MSGGSDLFYLFIFAIWLRRDAERKREKSRCAQLLAAARDLVPSSAPGPAELSPIAWPLSPPNPQGQAGDTPGHPPCSCRDDVWVFRRRWAQPGHPACWSYAGLVAIDIAMVDTWVSPAVGTW